MSGNNLNQKVNQIELPQADVRLARWRHLQNTPEKLAAWYRQVVLERVAESMAFENQPVDLERLRKLISEKESIHSQAESRRIESCSSAPELSERLAVPLVAIYDEILQESPKQLVINSEWLCIRHKRLAGHLFPDWAGRFRDVNVQVGSHTPPPYYEVPIHMRQFCDDLSARLLHLNQESVANCAELLAWADGRFQWIHPFKDFNGRIGRALLAALLYKLALPHVETAPLEPSARRQYLEALNAADDSNLGPLTELWAHRIAGTL
ncbi:MAG: Fic family protein [Nitrospira sp.]|nr:Fic family protein [Nitrospira sp.]